MATRRWRFTTGQVGGFTLPTVVIVSLVMMIVLVSALQIVSTTRRALETQYYTQLAREAAEAGAVYIADCMRRGYFVAGTSISPGRSCTNGNVSTQNDYVAKSTSDRYRSTFSATYESNGTIKQARVTGILELLGPGNTVQDTYEYSLGQQVTREIDITAARPSKRWWKFGSASLDFGPTDGTLTSSGSTPTSVPPEGMTTVSDRSGNLLFYSDGLSIWDRNGSLMSLAASSPNVVSNCDTPSGYTFPFASGSQKLCGSRTGTQAVASFPINADETKFVVVTNTANAIPGIWGGRGTLYWSLVEVNSAYPNGRILSRNNRVHPTSVGYSAEALNARPRTSGVGGVVYTYNPTGSVYGWTFTSTNDAGVDINVSSMFTAPFVQKATICTGGARFGTISFHPDYTRMAVMMGGGGCTGGDGTATDKHLNAGRVLILSIGPGDTTISPQVNFKVGYDPNTARANYTGSMGYSADWSPSGDYLYVSTIYPGSLLRYKVNSGGYAAVEASELFVGYTNCQWPNESPTNCYGNYRLSSHSYLHTNGTTQIDGGGQVMRGPDGKMYVANRGAQKISVVNNPDSTTNTASGIGWQYGAIQLSGSQYSMYGLPQMVTLYSPRVWQY